MASYTFDLALVKYYRESLNEYATFMPFKIANTKDQAFYAKISIINQGNLLWYFDDGAGNLVTEKTYTINANSVLSLNEKLVASTTPTETQKDQITILVEYFKDDTLLNKFGEDTITVPIHIFIQNADYSWTSTQYPNESDIVFEKWKATLEAVSQAIGSGSYDLIGDLMNAKLRFYEFEDRGENYVRLDSDVEVIEPNNSLKITLYAATNFYNSAFNVWCNIAPYDALDNLLTGKFLAMFVRTQGLTNYQFGFSISPQTNNDSAVSSFVNNSVDADRKLVFLPFETLAPTLRLRKYAKGGYGYAWLDAIYLFNKLP